MNNSLADTYYLKALESYQYDHENTSDNLAFALSYDPDHREANLLTGRFKNEVLQQPNEALYYLEKAIAQNPKEMDSFIYAVEALTKMGEYSRALKMLEYCRSLNQRGSGVVSQKQAWIAELQGQIKEAKTLLKQAFQESCYDQERDFYQQELKRIKTKLKTTNKTIKAVHSAKAS